MEPGGQLDMQQLLAAAQQMQEQLMDAQQELADAEVEGTAGGGLVTAVVNGQGELLATAQNIFPVIGQEGCYYVEADAVAAQRVRRSS